jgi:hypothetical protein
MPFCGLPHLDIECKLTLSRPDQISVMIDFMHWQSQWHPKLATLEEEWLDLSAELES